MQQILLIIHFLSFSAAIGAATANLITGARMATIPSDARPQVGAIRLTIGQVSTFGLILLWLTGIAMVVTSQGSAVFDNPLFVIKMLVVIVLTVISTLLNLTIARARAAGTPPDPARMMRLGKSGLAAAVLALILAILAFS